MLVKMLFGHQCTSSSIVYRCFFAAVNTKSLTMLDCCCQYLVLLVFLHAASAIMLHGMWEYLLYTIIISRYFLVLDCCVSALLLHLSAVFSRWLLSYLYLYFSFNPCTSKYVFILRLTMPAMRLFHLSCLLSTLLLGVDSTVTLMYSNYSG